LTNIAMLGRWKIRISAIFGALTWDLAKLWSSWSLSYSDSCNMAGRSPYCLKRQSGSPWKYCLFLMGDFITGWSFCKALLFLESKVTTGFGQWLKTFQYLLWGVWNRAKVTIRYLSYSSLCAFSHEWGWEGITHSVYRQTLLESLTCLHAELSRCLTQSFKTKARDVKWKQRHQAVLLLVNLWAQQRSAS
jgi:hypothetical protein